MSPGSLRALGVFAVVLVAGTRGVVAQESAPEEPPAEEPTPQAKGVHAVELRVVEVGLRDEVTIDRGASDGLAAGDLVLFFGAGGATLGGVVVETFERTARVRRSEPSAVLTVGTRGRVYVPRARLAAREERAAPRTDDDLAPWLVPEAPAEKDAWTPDMPLLAGIEAVHPRDRSPRYGGRVRYTLDAIASDTDRTDVFTRAGADVWYDNPFGRGGVLHLDVEGNYRRRVEPDGEDEQRVRLRTDRLSYAWGGTRFDGERFQVGRFLQSGMPEFGVLDGGEYSLRLANGDRVGASVGWMPEPDLDHTTGTDFQLAAYYHWTIDDSERFTLETGIQKTLHDGDSDRDLLVSTFRYLPLEGWRGSATIWIDRYGASDPARGAGLGVTQLLASVSKNVGLESGQTISFMHREIPELDRNEFVQPLADELADDRLDRLSYDMWRRLDRGRRFHAHASGWFDEDDAGGNLDAGVEWRDVFRDGLRIDVTLFGGQAAYGFDMGADISAALETRQGLFEGGYDITRRQQDGFGAQRNTLFLHRVHLRHHWVYGSSWNLSTYLQGVLAEDEFSAQAGLALQKTF